MERTYEAPSNEASHMILGYHQGRLVTYLQFEFSGIAWGQAKNPKDEHDTFARLSQSEFYSDYSFVGWILIRSVLFDVDSGHERHSGELPLFEGHFVG